MEAPPPATSEVTARERSGPGKVADVEGETTEGWADVLTSPPGTDFADVEPAEGVDSVGALALGGIGEPVAEGT